MTDFSPDAVQAHLAAELSRAERQIDDAEKAMLHATICFGAARATIANVRAALAQPRKPFRKLALAGPRFDLVQESGRSSTAGSYADASDEPIEPWMETTK